MVQGRPHRDGVKARQRVGEQAAFQARVDGLHLHLFSKQLPVALFKYLADPGILSVAPARIFPAAGVRKAKGLCQKPKSGLHLLLERSHRGPGREHQHQPVRLCPDDAHVHGAYHEAVHMHVAALHAVRRQVHGRHVVLRGLCRNGRGLRSLFFFHSARKAFLIRRDFSRQHLCQLSGQLLRLRSLVRLRVNQGSMALSGNGVVLIAARQIHKPSIRVLHQLPHDSRHQAVGVLALLVDIHAGVSALQAADGKTQQRALRRLSLNRPRALDPQAPGAAHRSDSLVLGIHIDHGAGGDQRLIQGGSSIEPHLLLCGKDALHRRMYERLVVQHCQHQGDRYAVVGSQRGPVRSQHAVLYRQLQPFLRKIVLHSRILLADHIQVSLQHHRRAVLRSRAPRLFDDDIPGPILVYPEASLLREFHEVVADPLFVSRTSGNRADLLKKMK